MRNLFILFTVLFMTSAVVYSAPNYNPNGHPIIYDDSYNIALRKKLEDNYDKKYIVKQTSNEVVYDSPLGSYRKEVLEPFYDMQIPMEKLPKTYSKQ